MIRHEDDGQLRLRDPLLMIAGLCQLCKQLRIRDLDDAVKHLVACGRRFECRRIQLFLDLLADRSFFKHTHALACLQFIYRAHFFRLLSV